MKPAHITTLKNLVKLYNLEDKNIKEYIKEVEKATVVFSFMNECIDRRLNITDMYFIIKINSLDEIKPAEYIDIYAKYHFGKYVYKKDFKANYIYSGFNTDKTLYNVYIAPLRLFYYGITGTFQAPINFFSVEYYMAILARPVGFYINDVKYEDYSNDIYGVGNGINEENFIKYVLSKNNACVHHKQA